MATGSDKNVTFNVNARDKTKRGLTSVQKNLQKTSREATALSQRFRSVARATVILEGPLGGTAGRLSALATLFNSVNAGAVAMGAGVAGLTAIGYQSLTAFAEYESQMFKVNTLLEQTGYASGQTADSINAMSREIGLATLESTEGVREAASTLLTFRSIAGDAFERTLKVAADLAATTNVDLRGAIIQLGKALEDPATGMSALRRSGVSFTNSQKDMIVALKEGGDAAAAQAEILGLLEGQLGGAAVGAGKGLAGAADAVAESWNNMLIALSESGAGELATRMLNGIANAFQRIEQYLEPGDDARLRQIEESLRIQFDLVEKNKQMYGDNAVAANQAAYQIIASLKREERAIRERTAAREAEAEKAEEQSRITQENMNREAAAESQREKAKKDASDAEKQRLKDVAAAQAYAQKLIAEEEKFQTSLLNRAQQEDIFLEERLMKIQENLDNELLTKQEALAAEQAAYALHNSKLTEIEGEQKAKRMEAEQDRQRETIAATSTALGDISGMMASQNKHLFKIGKAAAIARAIINMHEAVTKTMASVPYPWNIPLAAAQGAAALVQIQAIRSQQYSAARQFGGTVIGGRTYLVGEKGPELFQPGTTGNIITNNETRNIAGNTNTIDVTVVNDVGDAFIERNAQAIWDNILDRMNEEGMRFA